MDAGCCQREGSTGPPAAGGQRGSGMEDGRAAGGFLWGWFGGCQGSSTGGRGAGRGG